MSAPAVGCIHPATTHRAVCNINSFQCIRTFCFFKTKFQKGGRGPPHSKREENVLVYGLTWWLELRFELKFCTREQDHATDIHTLKIGCLLFNIGTREQCVGIKMRTEIVTKQNSDAIRVFSACIVLLVRFIHKTSLILLP